MTNLERLQAKLQKLDQEILATEQAIHDAHTSAAPDVEPVADLTFTQTRAPAPKAPAPKALVMVPAWLSSPAPPALTPPAAPSILPAPPTVKPVKSANVRARNARVLLFLSFVFFPVSLLILLFGVKGGLGLLGIAIVVAMMFYGPFVIAWGMGILGAWMFTEAAGIEVSRRTVGIAKDRVVAAKEAVPQITKRVARSYSPGYTMKASLIDALFPDHADSNDEHGGKPRHQ